MKKYCFFYVFKNKNFTALMGVFLNGLKFKLKIYLKASDN